MIDPDSILETYDEAHLRCRADRHRWGRRAQWFVADRSHNERHIVCEDCGTRRIETINVQTYQRVGPVKYRYAHGYLTPKSGLTLDDFRSEMLRQDLTRATREHRIGEKE